MNDLLPDLFDQFADKIHWVSSSYRSFGGHQCFYGPIETVKCFEDNSKVKSLLNQPGQGRVLVVDGGGSMRRALLGDLIAASAIANGWAGVIINGCIRDAGEIADMAIGVQALGTAPIKTEKLGVGIVGETIELNNIKIRSGQWIYADLNGIAVSESQLEIE
ncbi:putative 4-hydroxy-4-methyl-2-oxoglutarate aldolase [Paraferrimonas haliotis]|uniref:4-hydroxy-4-methyl-2-oxoglutarate aldolase n=1 Tax=Paraferrimonas haliotis TaxID=2013866 RepID=A0AA37WYK2_9GAMM|nr:putative 4-hydroxy-4-methyl-2-oxoglutarate aldolase [Paraferrimonas haliotis]GLS84484.1 putative 4-hydroxy-4-methyl-2-oxoglutarate aldolase [Paraferrimonas haliotis]